MSTDNKPDKPEGESCHRPEEHRHEHEHGHKHEHGHEHEHLVNITIDTKLHKIRPGEHTVAQIKDLGKVPQAFDLEQLINGKLVPLPDGGCVVIKGGEVFLSHPKDGGAS